MIKVRLEQGIYEVYKTKDNMKAFNDKNIGAFFVKCSPEESQCGFPFALVEKKDVIEVLEDEYNVATKDYKKTWWLKEDKSE